MRSCPAQARLDELGSIWLAGLEDRDGSLFATAIDRDVNLVQLSQVSEEHRATVKAGRVTMAVADDGRSYT